MAVTHVPACCAATSTSIELDPVAQEHGHVTADRHAAVVEHPVPEPPGPIEELAARAAPGEVVDGGGVGIGRDLVEEGHAADPGRDQPHGRAVTCRHGWRRARHQGRHRRARWPTSGIAVAKFVGFVITGSASMLAESIHSVADSGNQGLLLLGGRRARREADAAHPFGYGRERYFWAFVVALVLFSLGGAFAIFEGIEKIRHPHELESPGVAIGILLFAIVLETFSFRTAIVESNKIRGDAGWWQFIRRSKNPELPVVLLEDFGAEIGLAHRAVRHHGHARHGRPDLGRHRHALIGLLLDRHRRRAGQRDEEPAARARRPAPRWRPRSGRRIEGDDRRRAAHPPAHPAPRPRRAARRRQGQLPRRPGGERAGRRRSTGSRRSSGRACPRPGSCTSSPMWSAHGHGSRREPAPIPAGRRQLEALGELIRKQRQQAELTLRDLAERTNVSNPYLSQIERGLHEPSVRVLKAIAAALNLSAESLLIQAGVLDGHESVRRAGHRGGGRQRRPPAHRRPARRAAERLPQLRRGRSEAPAQASLSAQERRSGGRSAARLHQSLAGQGVARGPGIRRPWRP